MTTPEQGQRQRLAAIFMADAVGFSRLMALDESATVVALDSARASFREQIQVHDGRVVDTAGDSVLAVFDTASAAIRAAMSAQKALEAQSAGRPPAKRLQYRIGVHVGEVIEKPDGTVYGDGVNVVARLQTLAEPGGVVVSGPVRGAVGGRLGVNYTDLGTHSVKNIVESLHAYGLHAPANVDSWRSGGWLHALWALGFRRRGACLLYTSPSPRD